MRTHPVLLLALVSLLAACNVIHGDDDQDAKLVIELLHARPGHVVADIGAGNDAPLAIRVARHLGPQGRLYATELGTQMVQSVRNATKEAGLRNVVVVEAHAERTHLPPLCCDGIYMRNVYHHFGNTRAMNTSLFASLKPGGRLVVIDFEPRSMLFDRSHGVLPKQVADELGQAGFDLVSSKPHPDADAFVVVVRKPSGQWRHSKPPARMRFERKPHRGVVATGNVPRLAASRRSSPANRRHWSPPR